MRQTTPLLGCATFVYCPVFSWCFPALRVLCLLLYVSPVWLTYFFNHSLIDSHLLSFHTCLSSSHQPPAVFNSGSPFQTASSSLYLMCPAILTCPARRAQPALVFSLILIVLPWSFSPWTSPVLSVRVLLLVANKAFLLYSGLLCGFSVLPSANSTNWPNNGPRRPDSQCHVLKGALLGQHEQFILALFECSMQTKTQLAELMQQVSSLSSSVQSMVPAPAEAPVRSPTLRDSHK